MKWVIHPVVAAVVVVFWASTSFAQDGQARCAENIAFCQSKGDFVGCFEQRCLLNFNGLASSPKIFQNASLSEFNDHLDATRCALGASGADNCALLLQFVLILRAVRFPPNRPPPPLPPPPPPPPPPPTPEQIYNLMLNETVVAEEKTAIQSALDFFFGTDFEGKNNALASYIRKSVERCAGRNVGDVCNFFPPARCRGTSRENEDLRCSQNLPEVLITGTVLFDTFRRIVQSLQEDACANAGGDQDEDFMCGMQDNCPTVANGNQLDSNRDGTGDACTCSSERTRQDQDGDGILDCQDPCLLFSGVFSGFIPNVGATNCGCQPVALTGRGQLRTWSGGAGVSGVPHLDALRCNFSADDPPTTGPFLLRDVTRQTVNAFLPGHQHLGMLNAGPSAVLSQEMVTKFGNDIVSKNTMEEYANAASKEDRAAIDAQVGAQLFYDFLRTIPGASGRPIVSVQDPLPGPMASMISLVNEPISNDPDGDTLGITVFDGVNVFVAYPPLSGPIASAALDVVGHEWFHAFTRLTGSGRQDKIGGVTGGLAGSDNPPLKAKAVEEAFADAIGVSFEMIIASQGRIPGKPSADFRMAEDTGQVVVDLANPRANGRPDHVLHVDFRNKCAPDSPTESTTNGGGLFQVNSRICGGPFQKAYHLLVAGGSFPSAADRSAGGGYTAPTVTISGIGVQAATRIVFRADQTQWQRGRNYKHYAVGMITAAGEIFGANSQQVQSTINAFDAVGLLPGRLTIRTSVLPAGAGTVAVTPNLAFQGTQLTATATRAAGRTFAGFVLRFPDGSVSTLRTENPLTNINAEAGLTIEARFNQ